MKMVRRPVRVMARCHEHGMDRGDRFDEVAAASDEASVVSAHER
jgi:hypothetical protein